MASILSCLKSQKHSEEINKIITAKKNKKMAEAFASVPFSERVIFVPQCLRNIEKCKAKEIGSYYICAECGGCKVSFISKKSKELGYKGLYILKGGRTVEKLIKELKPKAILGVACYFEGAQGMDLTEKSKIPVQFVALTRDGCVDTDLEIEELYSMLWKK